MNLQHRIDLMAELGRYILQNDMVWQDISEKAYQHNPWFTPEFIQKAAVNIAEMYLQKQSLEEWVSHYRLDDNIEPVSVGVVMAGNIPMVGFHDLLSVFICGHQQTIKLSSKDDVLMDFIVKKIHSFDKETEKLIQTAPMLKGCDAYIATGSNNTARYFEQYFAKYPHIIRRNKTSVGILTGNETKEELESLSDDIHLYFGLGCRNITKLYVPEGYDFVPLVRSFDKYNYFKDHHKYFNNFEYQLSLMLMNNVYYMSSGATLLAENPAVFSSISVVNYEFYKKGKNPAENIDWADIQSISGPGFLPFGQAQSPDLFCYADGVDTMQFLLTL